MSRPSTTPSDFGELSRAGRRGRAKRTSASSVEPRGRDSRGGAEARDKGRPESGDADERLPRRPLPRHVAIIMDGNGRWAAERGLSRLEGHRAGADAVDAVVRASAQAGVGVLTLYAFSSENWSRPPGEVEALFALLVEFLKQKTPELVENGIALRTLGRKDELPASARRALEESERETSAGRRMTLCLAVAYGGQDEVVDAARRLARLAAEGELAPDDIDREAVARHLYTAGLPPVDLLIRTGGERRVSNFLLWQISYAELYFTDVRWPDFTRERLEEALADYARRERRFGATSAGESP